MVCTSRTRLRHTPRHENSNFQKFKMADGRYFENDFIAISQLRMDHPISMKFGVPLQIVVLRTVTWQSIKILQIQNCGRPLHWKSFLAISRLIVWLTRNLIWRSRITFRYRSCDQNTKIWKFKMVDDRHFENGLINIISAADHPISIKFGVPLHNLVPRKVTY